jgi:SAM-dependent methyltransferase
MEEVLKFGGYDVPTRFALRTGSRLDNYAEIADWHVAQVQRYVGIKPTDNVVEIGCGIGRMAIPLTRMLTSGSYLGTEVMRDQVLWLTEHVSSRHTNFSFVHHDIHDTLHNPNGAMSAEDVRLPSADASIDLTLLFSVFTHMFGDEVAHYLDEFHRILKPDGRVYASFFLVNQPMLEEMRSSEKPGWGFRFVTPHGDRCFIDKPKQPRQSVAFLDDKVEEMVQDAGFEIERVLHGNWSGLRPEPKSGQDVIILKKA